MESVALAPSLPGTNWPTWRRGLSLIAGTRSVMVIRVFRGRVNDEEQDSSFHSQSGGKNKIWNSLPVNKNEPESTTNKRSGCLQILSLGPCGL